MRLSLRAARALSLLCALALIASAALWLGLRDARAYLDRGRPTGFPEPVFGAPTLRVGVNAALEQYSADRLDAILADLAARDIRFVRQEFRWADIETIKDQPDWTTSDRIVNAARAHGITLLPVLWTTPVWARAASGSDINPPTLTAPPANLDDWARFVRAFARRYDTPASDTFLAYQIWDEPNLSAAWGNGLINPSLYLQMLRAARSAIHDVSPNATLALAALAPTVEQSAVNLAPQTYLLKLYQLGGHQAFDIVAAKPYGFETAPGDRRVDAAVLNVSHMTLLREVMVAHGEGHKAIWGAQFGWNAMPPNWQGEPSVWGAVSEVQQADHTRTLISRAATEWPWLGALFVENLQPAPRVSNPSDDPRWGFAMLDQRGAPRPVFEALTESIAQLAPIRANLFAHCRSPQSLARSLRLENLITAFPEVMAARPDCQTPNPLAQFTEGWRFDQLGADIPERPDAKLTLRFHGDALALIVRRGNYRAYTYVSIDGQPANLLPTDARGAYLIMTSPGLYPVIETIPVARGLGPGEHTAEIVVDRGWNQWALLGWSTRTVDTGAAGASTGSVPALVLGLLAMLGLVIAVPRADVPGAGRALGAQLRRLNDIDGKAVIAGGLLWLTATLAWAQDAATAYRALGWPVNVALSGITSAVLFWSPALIISLVALVALAVLIVLRLETGLMLAAFFIPFFLLPQRLFERAFPMIEIVTLLCALSWALRMLKLRPRWPGWPTVTLLDWGVLALVGVALLSASQATQQVEAWREVRTVIAEPALLYLILRTSRLSEGATGRITTAFVTGAAAVACIGLFNYVRGERFVAEGGLPRIKSIFNSANNDALYLERVLPFALVMLTLRTRLPVLALRLAALAAITLALLLTQSRGALLFGVPAMLISMAVLAGGRWRTLGWLGLGAAALGLIVLISGVAQPLVEGTRLANAFDLTRGTGFFRLNLWQSAWRMFLDYPLLGVGPDNFLYAYRSFYILPAAWQEPNLSHPHNLLFDFATRLGAPGLLAGLLMIIGLALTIRRNLRGPTRSRAIAAGGMLAAILAHGMVDHAFFLVDLMFAFMLVAGLQQSERA
jgi:O-antigen ligase